MSETVFETVLKELQTRTEDIRPTDVVLFSEPLRSALNYVIRLKRFSLSELAEKLEFTREQTRQIADVLVQRNLFVRSKFASEDDQFFESRVSALTRPMSRPPSELWKKID